MSSIQILDESNHDLLIQKIHSIIFNIDETVKPTSYSRLRNQHANLREYFMDLIENLPYNTFTDFQLQASILAKLTKTSSQLTRKTAVIKFCFYILKQET